MSDTMRLKGLLFSTDAKIRRVMNQVLNNFDIETEVCLEPSSALNAVNTLKLDTLIIDWTAGGDSSQILSAMRRSEQNAKSTVLAMVREDEEMLAARRAGANFVMYKPINVDQATGFLRAAYGNMLLQRRQAGRSLVDIPVVVHVFGAGTVPGKIVNLSVHGLAFVSEYDIRVDQQLSMEFKLPGNSFVTRVKGQVMNVISRDSWTRCGVCFSSLSQQEFGVLNRWLSDHMPEQPDEVVSSDDKI